MNSTEKMIEYFRENEEDFNRTIEELDSWNGYLDDDRWYPMDMLSECLEGTDPAEAIRMAHNGHFRPDDEYFRFNVYGNLESSRDADYSIYLDKWFVEALARNRSHLYLSDEVNGLLDGMEEEND